MNRKTPNKIPIIRLIPNIITFFSICVGLTALRSMLQGNLSLTLYLLILAMVLDALDGRIARAMQSESKVGAELDSLADFFNFGIATPLVVFLSIFLNSEFRILGWLSVMTVAVCCAFRLARFNVGVADSTSSDQTTRSDSFKGVPAPMLASLTMSPLFLEMLRFEMVEHYAAHTAFFLFFCGLLSIGSFPTPSIKGMLVPENLQFLLIFVVALSLALIVAYPWYTMLAFNLIYLLSLPTHAFVVWRREKDSGG